MTDNYRVQISGDIGNAMFVLRAETVDELVQQSAELAAKVDEIYDNLNNVKQVALLKEAFAEKKGFGNKGGSGGGSNYSKPSYSGGGAPAASSGGTTPDGAPTCAHGAMKAFNFTGSDGKPVSGHNCPLPKGADGRCKAKMNR